MTGRSPAPRDARPASRARRVLRGVALAIGVVIAVVALAAAFVLRDLDGRVRSLLVARAAELAEEIGRPVAVGAVEATLGWEAQVVVHDVVVGAAPGAAGPLARPPVVVPRARVGVDLGRLARTRGREVVVTRVEVEGAEIALVRTDTGLSIDDVRAKLAAPKPPPPPSAPSGPPPAVRLDRLALTGATLRYTDATTGAEIAIERVAIEGEGLRSDGPSRVTVRAGAGPKGELSATIDLAPPAAGGDARPTRVEVHAAGVAVAPLLAAARVAPAALDLAAATASLDATVEPGDAVHAKVDARLAGVRLAAPGPDGAREVGAPIELGLAADATVDAKAGTIVAKGVEARVGPIALRGEVAIAGVGAAPSVDRVDLAGSADAAALLDALPPGRRPARVAIAGPIAIAVRGGGGRDAASGSVKVSVAEARFADAAGAQGGPVAASIAADLAFDRAAGTLRATGLAVDVGGLVAKGEVGLVGLGAEPRPDAIAIDLAGPIDALIAAVPPAQRPRGLALRGAIAASLRARPDGDAWAGTASIDLARASLVVRGLAKPAGVSLAAEVEGRARPGAVDLARARLRLGPVVATARGRIAGPERVDLAFDAEIASLRSLVALAPSIGERLGGKASVDGRLAAKGTVKRDGAAIAVTTTARLAGAELRRGLASLRGDVAAEVRASASGESADVRVDLDLGAAAIEVALVAKKPAGAPARLALVASRDGDRFALREGRVELPGLALSGVEVAAAPGSLRVRCAPDSTIVASKLLALAAPIVRSRAPAWLDGATLRFGLELAGDPDDLAAASLTVGAFELATASARVRGSASVDAVGRPRKVRVDVTGGEVTLPEGLGGGDDLAIEAPADVRVEGRVHLDALRAAGHVATGVDLEVAIDEGRLRVESLRAGLYGGTVRLLPSTIDLSDVPSLDVHARFDAIDLAAVPRGAIDELAGRLSGSVDLAGRGATGAALVASLRGDAALAAKDVHVKGAWEPKWRLANRWLAALAERRRKATPPGPRTLDARELTASFAIDRGKIVTRAPLVLRSDDVEVKLEGAVGLDRAIALDGQAAFSPRAVAERTGGALTPKGAVPLRLRVSGRLGAPEVELVDLADTLKALRGAAAAGADAPF